MAEEHSNGEEKTEAPTAKRRHEAKEQGQVPRSRELTTLLAMLSAAGGLLIFGNYMTDSLADALRQGLHVGRDAIFDPQAPIRLLREMIAQGLWAVGPLALVLLLVALVAPVALGGWTFSAKALAPKLSKLDPVKGLKRLFGVHGLVELGKSLAKVMLVGAVGTYALWQSLDDFQALAAEALFPALQHAARIFNTTFLMLATALILIALVDVPFQLWDHTRKLRMTKQELKDELKQTEGKPEVKSRIRQLQQQAAQGRMMEQVPKADVVVTNPTHFAVALRYDPLHMRAPRLMAKGTDLIAQRIRRIAEDNGVPLFEAPPLARALHYTTELDQEVPAGLYLAVAQVLAYIYQLRNHSRAGPARPRRPEPTVPEEFLKYVRPRRQRR
ncbi:flagellar biosynthesis protein FlhB [Nitrococcus mobilis]|uniref:Flagellar biosynthetic protein FlhB n=1 Tax=Nitrococcus mobilis Nb-231 TaxID=314278 RepID=A4BUE9_9GAMM|nr:flagellar biosynthesis protein FlhB [Nitrococcus mobilis]EAR20663.1 flagellar biosynthesis protein [Nitrococcus mobilis Nb-231]